MKKRILILLILIFLPLLGVVFYKSSFVIYKEPNKNIEIFSVKSKSLSMKMFHSIKKYSKLYDIPEDYVFTIAFLESTYRGPFDTHYNPFLVSSSGALGPMQILPSTAKFINGGVVDTVRLLKDIDYNVQTSVKLLRYLKDKYDNWILVFGAYNTGKPIENEYACSVIEKKYNWKEKK